MTSDVTPMLDPPAEATIRDAFASDVEYIVKLQHELDLGIISTLSAGITTVYFGNIVNKKIFVCRCLLQADTLVGFYVINLGMKHSRAQPFYATPFATALNTLASPRSLATMAAYALGRAVSPQARHLDSTFGCELLYIGISPSSQGMGYGTFLLSDIKEIMKHHRIDYLGLEVLADDGRAQRFYRRFSPQIAGEVAWKGTRSQCMRIHRDNLPSTIGDHGKQ